MGSPSTQTREEEFERHLSKKVFAYKEVLHFRTSWFAAAANRRILNSLESIGHLERAGTIGELRDGGMEFPDEPAYTVQVRSAVIYRVINEELNKRLLGMIQNSKNQNTNSE